VNKLILKKNNFKKAAIINRSFFVIVIFMSVICNSFSQETEIRHYQKKCSMDSVILPGQLYDSKLYSIPFPDSLYTGGIISIKKIRINGIKAQSSFSLSNNTYTEVKYTLSKRNKNKFMKLINVNNNKYNLHVKKNRIKYTITLQLKESSVN
tara:strand:+ start:475 stop:930 length:456 start_codon:yes stop_codon:yes gene_type:complete